MDLETIKFAQQMLASNELNITIKAASVISHISMDYNKRQILIR